jgi:RNase P subunit RPR2
MGSKGKKPRANGMHRCPRCRSILVQPVDIQEEDGGRWFVQLRCPDCEWRRRGSYSKTEVDRYTHELDRGDQ